MKLNYKKIVEGILLLVETDFHSAMELKQMPGSKPYTQKEAKEMDNIIGRVYLIAHCLHCEACQKKYIKSN